MSDYSYNSEIGQTDLMGAAHHGDAEAVDFILTMPCDIDAQDDHGMTAMMYAAWKGHTEVVEHLIEHKANLELQSGQHWTALMYAVRRGSLETVQALLRAKADPDVHGDYSTLATPLTIAAELGFFAVVRALEHFQKTCSHAVRPSERTVFWSFGIVSAQSQGFQTCSFAKASPKLQNPRSAWLQFFFKRSSCRRRGHQLARRL